MRAQDGGCDLRGNTGAFKMVDMGTSCQRLVNGGDNWKLEQNNGRKAPATLTLITVWFWTELNSAVLKCGVCITVTRV